MKFLLSVALLALSFSCLAQNETEKYVFWQPNVKLTFDMLRGTPTDSVVGKLLDKKVFHRVVGGLWGVLDIPEKKMLRGSTIDFTLKGRKLTIGARKGSFPGMLQNRTFRIMYIDGNTVKGQTVNYNGKAVTVSL